jgi:hypothetical protein
LQQSNPVRERRDISQAFYEYLDHLASTELKARSTLQGSTRLRYEAARRKQGDVPLSRLAAERIVRALKPGAVVLLTTGTGNAVWLPRGETDGPSGLAVLARLFSGLGHRVCLLSEQHYLPGIVASIEAAGVPTLERASWDQRSFGLLPVEFPVGRAAAEAFVDTFLDAMPHTAVALFLEKPGPNVQGVFHNSTGKPKPPESLGHLNWLAERCRTRGIVTGAVGDGGNEIGFGLIRRELAAEHPYAKECGCPCGHGIIDATVVDFLFPAAVSNWGGYAIAVAIAMGLGASDLLPDLCEVEQTIRAPLSHGAFDGYSGLRVPTVDGTSLPANRAVYQLMLEVMRLAAPVSA